MVGRISTRTGAAHATCGGRLTAFFGHNCDTAGDTCNAAAIRCRFNESSSLNITRDGDSACHSADKKIVGPSYKEVAVKYAGDSGAHAKLEQKIKNGGSGVWGAIPMPPNNVPDADLKTLVEWILATK